jgi:hypothetical protein
MAVNNSSVAFYATIVNHVHTSIANSFGVSRSIVSVEQRKIARRLNAEGLPFLTVCLPRLGKAFDKALATNTAFNPEGFEKLPGTTTPKFLGWLFSQVFDKDGIVLQDGGNPSAVKHIRQLVYLFYKLELPYAKKTCQKVVDAFVQTETDLQSLQIDSKDRTIRLARAFITRVAGDLDPLDIVPRHGPGAVSTGEKGLNKANFGRIYSDVEQIYPFTEYFCFSLGHVVDELGMIESLEPLEAGTAKVVLVPKDSRGPRLISCEPLELQWLQQGLSQILVTRLESHSFTNGHVNFTDQVVNKRLALSSSLSQEWVTLDMKEASDRVSLELVSQLFQGCPILRGLIATRSKFTQLPDGRLIEMKKFAPMGSALCFPVEAFVFYALSVAVLRIYARMSWRQARESVYVYGDDLIIRAEVYKHVLQHLPRFGLLFNDGKCCTDGFFRESCGCDAYKGVDVTPIKIRSVWSRRGRIDPGVLASYVSYSNSLYLAGHYEASQFIEEECLRRFPGIPINNAVVFDYSAKADWKNVTPKGVSFYRPHICATTNSRNRIRRSKKLQRLEVSTPLIVPIIFEGDVKSGWREMLRLMGKASQRTTPGQYTLPRRVKMERGWTEVSDVTSFCADSSASLYTKPCFLKFGRPKFSEQYA